SCLADGSSGRLMWRQAHRAAEDPPSCPGARHERLRAHSLSIAETQIWKALTQANPPGGEPLESRDGIRNTFILFSFLAFSAPFAVPFTRLVGGVTAFVAGGVPGWRIG